MYILLDGFKFHTQSEPFQATTIRTDVRESSQGQPGEDAERRQGLAVGSSQRRHQQRGGGGHTLGCRLSTNTHEEANGVRTLSISLTVKISSKEEEKICRQGSWLSPHLCDEAV